MAAWGCSVVCAALYAVADQDGGVQAMIVLCVGIEIFDSGQRLVLVLMTTTTFISPSHFAHLFNPLDSQAIVDNATGNPTQVSSYPHRLPFIQSISLALSFVMSSFIRIMTSIFNCSTFYFSFISLFSRVISLWCCATSSTISFIQSLYIRLLGLRSLWGCVGLNVPALPSSAGHTVPTPHTYLI